VGLVPADDPDLVVLVSVAGPQGDAAWGGVVAAPAFRRIVEGFRSPGR
jgi:cell division protein FtsI/penicillin-binding protein 2